MGDFLERKSGYDMYTLSAVAVALEQTKVYRSASVKLTNTIVIILFGRGEHTVYWSATCKI